MHDDGHGAPSSSAFYNRMRQSLRVAPGAAHPPGQAHGSGPRVHAATPDAFGATPQQSIGAMAYGGRGAAMTPTSTSTPTLNATLERLRSITARRGDAPRNGQQRPNTSQQSPQGDGVQPIVPSGVVRNAAVPEQPVHRPDFTPREQHGVSPASRATPARTTDSVPRVASPAAVAQDDSGLTPAELDVLRVAELDAKVKVLADVSQRSTGELTNLCDEAVVKVFPRHVVFSRPSGSPVVELVIAELFELTEDDAQQTLRFHLQRASGVTVIEVVTPSVAVRSALYKLVCSKRNALEAQQA